MRTLKENNAHNVVVVLYGLHNDKCISSLIHVSYDPIEKKKLMLSPLKGYKYGF